MNKLFSSPLYWLAIAGGGYWWFNRKKGQANYGYLPSSHDCGCGG